MRHLPAVGIFLFVMVFGLAASPARAYFWTHPYSTPVSCYDRPSLNGSGGALECSFAANTITVTTRGVETDANLILTSSRSVRIVSTRAYARLLPENQPQICADVSPSACTVYVCRQNIACMTLNTTAHNAYGYTQAFNGIWGSGLDVWFTIGFNPSGTGSISPPRYNDSTNVVIAIDYEYI